MSARPEPPGSPTWPRKAGEARHREDDEFQERVGDEHQRRAATRMTKDAIGSEAGVDHGEILHRVRRTGLGGHLHYSLFCKARAKYAPYLCEDARMATLQHLAWDDFRLVKAIAEARRRSPARPSGWASTIRPCSAASARSRRSSASRSSSATGPAMRSTPAGEEMAALAERMEEDVAAFARKLAGQRRRAGGRVARHHQRHAAGPSADADLRALPTRLPGRSGSTWCWRTRR